MDDSPITDKKPSKAKIIWIVALVLLLIACNTAWGLFYFNQQNKLNQSIRSLGVDKQVLKEELVDAKKSTKIDDTSDEWREIPELKVKYKVTSNTKDLTYLYENGSVSFSTKSLSDSSYKGKNPSGNTIDAYLCGLSGSDMGGGFSAGGFGLVDNYKENAEKQKPDIVKKLSNGKTVVYYTEAAGNGSGTTDAQNAITPTPAQGCSQALRDSAIKATKEAVNSLQSID